MQTSVPTAQLFFAAFLISFDVVLNFNVAEHQVFRLRFVYSTFPLRDSFSPQVKNIFSNIFFPKCLKVWLFTFRFLILLEVVFVASLLEGFDFLYDFFFSLRTTDVLQ